MASAYSYDVTGTSHLGTPPRTDYLVEAVKKGDVGEAERLLEGGADANAYTSQAEPLLFLAIEQGFEELVDLLLKYKAKIEGRLSKGRTPLSHAVILGQHNIVKCLIQHGADVNEKMKRAQRTRLPLCEAVTRSDEEMVQILLDAGSLVNRENGRGNNVLGRAVALSQKSIAIIKLLLEKGADPNVRENVTRSKGSGKAALGIVANEGPEELVKLLIQYGADVNFCDVKGEAPIHWAVKNDEDSIVQRLIETPGMNLNIEDENGWTALCHAAANGARKSAGKLLQAGAYLPARPLRSDDLTDGTTIYHLAAEKGVLEILKLAPDFVRDNAGRSPAHSAAGAEQAKCLYEMRDKFDLNLQDKEGTSPLHLAAKGGHEGAVSRLLTFHRFTDGKVKIDAQDRYGNTSLHHAITERHLLCIHALIDGYYMNSDRGARIDIHNNEGKSCLDLAREIPDDTDSKAMIAALFLKPPPPDLMSKDEWYRQSVENGRDLLRLLKRKALDTTLNKRSDGGQDQQDSVLPGVGAIESAGYSFLPMLNVMDDTAKRLLSKKQSVYSMHHRPRGVAVIMNNINFPDPDHARLGTEIDVERLKCLFKRLYFDVEYWEDCTAQDMENRINNLKKKDHKNSDAFVFVAMSHGAPKCIYSSDYKELDIRENIEAHFHADKFLAMAGKPKIFIIQACRGKEGAEVVDALCDLGEDTTSSDQYQLPGETHPKAHIITINSTYDGEKALRTNDAVGGSWFITEFILACELFAHERDLALLVTTANSLLQHRKSQVNRNQVQVAQCETSVAKQLYFLPGYHDDYNFKVRAPPERGGCRARITARQS